MPKPIFKPSNEIQLRQFLQDLVDEMKAAEIRLVVFNSNGVITKRHTNFDAKARELFTTSKVEREDGSFESRPFSGRLRPEVTKEQAREILADAELLILFLQELFRGVILSAAISDES